MKPSDSDIQKFNTKLNHLQRNLTDGVPLPLTEKQLIQIIRSAVRKKWMSSVKGIIIFRML